MINDYYGYFKDSIYMDSRSSLNATGRESLRDMAVLLFSQFSEYHRTEIDSLKQEFSGFYQYLQDVRSSNSVCAECNDKRDYDAGLERYRDLLDSLGDDFQGMIELRTDLADSLLNDSLLGCEDSLAGFTDYLLDKQPANLTTGVNKEMNRGENEQNASELDIDLTYINHESYRGRDNGVHENSYSPSIMFTHSSGLGISAGLKWLNHAKHALDQVDIGLSFSHQIYRLFSGSLSFTRFWFRDSASLARSDLGNNVEGGLYMNSRYFNSGLVLDYDFGGGHSEFSANISGSLPLIISKRFLGGTLATEPGINLVYGQQNSALVILRRIRRSVLAAGKKSSSTFGIMSYEFNLPLELDYEHLIVNLSMTYIIPANVLDASTNHRFFSFTIDLIVPFRF
jgi:hypothetical protein